MSGRMVELVILKFFYCVFIDIFNVYILCWVYRDYIIYLIGKMCRKYIIWININILCVYWYSKVKIFSLSSDNMELYLICFILI